jgi:hypothetical protein
MPWTSDPESSATPTRRLETGSLDTFDDRSDTRQPCRVRTRYLARNGPGPMWANRREFAPSNRKACTEAQYPTPPMFPVRNSQGPFRRFDRQGASTGCSISFTAQSAVGCPAE